MGGGGIAPSFLSRREYTFHKALQFITMATLVKIISNFTFITMVTIVTVVIITTTDYNIR
jgi:hypothetical protein